MSTTKNQWWVYFLRCKDESLYCGVTNDLERRLLEHNTSKRGSKYTRARRPVELVWWAEAESKSWALRMEHRLKSLSKSEKEKIVADNKNVFSTIDCADSTDF